MTVKIDVKKRIYIKAGEDLESFTDVNVVQGIAIKIDKDLSLTADTKAITSNEMKKGQYAWAYLIEDAI
jgi:hypothetical protein